MAPMKITLSRGNPDGPQASPGAGIARPRSLARAKGDPTLPMPRPPLQKRTVTSHPRASAPGFCCTGGGVLETMSDPIAGPAFAGRCLCRGTRGYRQDRPAPRGLRWPDFALFACPAYRPKVAAFPQEPGHRPACRTGPVDQAAQTDRDGHAEGKRCRLSKVSSVDWLSQVRPRGLEPFFATKPIAKGPGLGLSMAPGLSRDPGGGRSPPLPPGRRLPSSCRHSESGPKLPVDDIWTSHRVLP